MIGIDISAGMVAVARQRRGHLYDMLLVGDGAQTLLSVPDLPVISAGVNRAVGPVDLVLAADVLVYIGDLWPTLHACAQVLRTGGLLAFTIEDLREEASPPPPKTVGSGLRSAP